MLKFIGLILLAANMFYAQTMPAYRSAKHDRAIGSLPEIAVTASRYEEEDIAYCGMLPQIVITASGPEVGILDAIVISAPRYPRHDIVYAEIIPFRMIRSRIRFLRSVIAVRDSQRSLWLNNMNL